jgi:hypothetical protein
VAGGSTSSMRILAVEVVVEVSARNINATKIMGFGGTAILISDN